MSFVTTQPEALHAAAGNLQGIGADMSAHQAASARASAIHQVFVSTLSAGGESYAATEAANAVTTG
jgi:hypothetical protein